MSVIKFPRTYVDEIDTTKLESVLRISFGMDIFTLNRGISKKKYENVQVADNKTTSKNIDCSSVKSLRQIAVHVRYNMYINITPKYEAISDLTD